MKFYPLICASTISLLSLTGCGGGGSTPTDSIDTPSDILPETKTAINLMLATSPDDSYFASAQSEGETLALFANSHSQSAMSDALIYNNSSDQVSFIRTNDATSYNRMLINGYQFDSMSTDSGAEIIVTAPSGQQETYYVDADGDLVQDSTSTEEDENSTGNGNTALTSCIASTAETSYCMNLDPTIFPESYCTVNGINTQGGGNGMFTSVSYSTTSQCAERGYPYNLSANNVEGWSAWYDFPVPGSEKALLSFSTRSLFEGNPFDTSACNDQMYDDNGTWSTCINQQITAFTAHAQVGFSKIFRSIVETYYDHLLPAFEKANDYVESVQQASDFTIEAATPKSFVTDTIDDLLKIGESTLQGLNKYFSGVEEGTYQEDDPELEALLGKVWSAAEEKDPVECPLGEADCPTAPNEEQESDISCRLTSGTEETIEQEEVGNLQCEEVDQQGNLVFERYEYMGPYGRLDQWEYKINFTNYNFVEDVQEGYTFRDIIAKTAERYNQTVRGYSAYSISTLNQLFYADFSYYSDSSKSMLSYRPDNEDEVRCSDSSGFWMNTSNKGYGDACPFPNSKDATLEVNDLGIDDMWLKSGKYKQYLDK